jgi:hypothetical protein
MAITVEVKIPWNNQVAIRDKYVDKAIKDNEDLIIIYDGKKMTIKNKDIVSKSTRKVWVTNKFITNNNNKKRHQLVYFSWLEDA